MTAGSYENDVKPIRGDTFLDKLFGWMTLVLGLAVLGVAIYRQTQPATGPGWLEPTRILLIVLGLWGAFQATLSTPAAFRQVTVLYAIRLVGCLALLPWSGGIRFASTEILFDVVVLGYAWLRTKALAGA